ncbi:sushi, von Willebrand factor type A, EGF and pentraxin domain-containing protein 1-like [Elysia marginata]|uniref:Sushi, von Willebrand factor type A, EGF and pentraxin domain-containing protein 1-like n=1 Tax=Elysia marginata TaxID=1093978 RepID=A0AAV4HJL7_9GAST|nr:sushi, von Willebrand factor type A, EGF and pentraxin domain-containing protein 1-like [Elysia marginata]
MNYTATTFGESVTVFCLPGFYPLTGLTLTCDETGNWTGDDLSCDLVNCGNPPSVYKAVAHYVATSWNAEARYECEDVTVGEDEDNSTSTCQEDGEWSPVAIQCIPVTCGAAPFIDNSNLTYIKSGDGEFEAIYTCHTGYVFDTRSTKQVCSLKQNVRKWRPDNGDGIRCVGVPCGAAPSVHHATVAESGRHFPAQASYTCEDGYVLTSAVSVRTCNEDGNWTTEDVTCDRPTCGMPTIPDHAVVSQGVKLQESYKHGDSVAYLCEDGHVTAPASSDDIWRWKNGNLTCLEGNWTMAEPNALCIACNIPPDVPHATWEIAKEKPFRVVYTCGTGYNSTADSDNTITCLETLWAWSGIGDIRCDLVDCGEPPAPGNGTVSTSGTKYNDTATYSCDYGHKAASGNSERQCGSEGTWSGSELECEIWNCEPPPDLAGGTAHHTSLRLNSTATYTCDPGRGFLEVSAVGNVSNTFAQSIDVVCNDQRVWMSISTQELIGSLECVEIQCSSALTIPNARPVNVSSGSILVNTTVQYECLGGFKHRGLDPEIMCKDDGTWSFPFFECLRTNCGPPPPIRYAAVSVDRDAIVGSKALYTCDNGYELVGNQTTRTCESDGLWSREFIECVPAGQKNCGDPPTLHAMATVDVHSLENTWTAVYTCAEGYQHAWSNTFDCSSPLFYWIAAPVIKCGLADCGDPPPVEHADAFHTHTTVGSLVIYRCHVDYVHVGDATKKCTSQGSWPTEPVVECVVPGTVSCGSPPDIMNSKRVYASTSVGSVATYTCDEGFTGSQFNAVCGADGEWTLRDPSSCSSVACGTVPSVQNSATSHPSGTTYGDVVVYKCAEGYKHTGTSLKTCEANGLWSPDIVECVPESSTVCGDPPRKDGAIVSYTSRVEGARATYSCDGNDFHSLCSQDGQWSNPSVTCERINCDLPTAIPNSEIVLTPKNMPSGRSVVHSCNPGFTSSTKAPLVSTCMKDGTWSPPEGTCEAVSIVVNEICERRLPHVPNGNPVSQNPVGHVGSILKYVCDAGYFPLPSSANFAHTCLSGPRWSSRPLMCYPGLCITTSAPVIANAEYVGLISQESITGGSTSVLLGSYNCSAGYTTDPAQPATVASSTSPAITVACDSSSGWADVTEAWTQRCQPVDCGNLELTEKYKATSANYNSTYTSQVEISCRSPWFQSIHDSAANKYVVCDATGHWSFEDTVLSCSPCDQTIQLPNGTLQIYANRLSQYAASASVRCDEEHYLIGPNTVQCDSINGTPKWRGLNESRCVKNVWSNIQVLSLQY